MGYHGKNVLIVFFCVGGEGWKKGGCWKKALFREGVEYDIFDFVKRRK